MVQNPTTLRANAYCSTWSTTAQSARRAHAGDTTTARAGTTGGSTTAATAATAAIHHVDAHVVDRSVPRRGLAAVLEHDVRWWCAPHVRGCVHDPILLEGSRYLHRGRSPRRKLERHARLVESNGWLVGYVTARVGENRLLAAEPVPSVLSHIRGDSCAKHGGVAVVPTIAVVIVIIVGESGSVAADAHTTVGRGGRVGVAAAHPRQAAAAAAAAAAVAAAVSTYLGAGPTVASCTTLARDAMAATAARTKLKRTRATFQRGCSRKRTTAVRVNVLQPRHLF